MKYLLFLLLFVSLIVRAETFYMFPEWIISTQREDGSELLFADIAGHKAYDTDCGTGVVGELVLDLSAFSTIQVVASATPVKCLKFTTMDTDGRVSMYSDMFILRPYDAPNPVECVAQ